MEHSSRFLLQGSTSVVRPQIRGDHNFSAKCLINLIVDLTYIKVNWLATLPAT